MILMRKIFQWYDALWIDFRMGHMMNSLPRIKSEWGVGGGFGKWARVLARANGLGTF